MNREVRADLPDLAVDQRLEAEIRAVDAGRDDRPDGQKVSKPLARDHWPSLFWRSRAVMSSAG